MDEMQRSTPRSRRDVLRTGLLLSVTALAAACAPATRRARQAGRAGQARSTSRHDGRRPHPPPLREAGGGRQASRSGQAGRSRAGRQDRRPDRHRHHGAGPQVPGLPRRQGHDPVLQLLGRQPRPAGGGHLDQAVPADLPRHQGRERRRQLPAAAGEADHPGRGRSPAERDDDPWRRPLVLRRSEEDRRRSTT